MVPLKIHYTYNKIRYSYYGTADDWHAASVMMSRTIACLAIWFIGTSTDQADTNTIRKAVRPRMTSSRTVCEDTEEETCEDDITHPRKIGVFLKVTPFRATTRTTTLTPSFGVEVKMHDRISCHSTQPTNI